MTALDDWESSIIKPHNIRSVTMPCKLHLAGCLLLLNRLTETENTAISVHVKVRWVVSPLRDLVFEVFDLLPLTSKKLHHV